MSVSTHLITYEESLLMPESNLEEVIDGELHVMPPATVDHSFIIQTLNLMFVRQLSPLFFCIQGIGYLMKRSPLRYRIPDLAIVDHVAIRHERRTAIDPYSRIVPKLVVEVVSPSNRKGSLQRLLQNYAEYGIPEVLLFRSQTRIYESYRGLEVVESAQTGTVSPQTMPEVLIDLNQIWGDSE